MHDQHDVARSQQRKPLADADDLVRKTFAAGRPAVRRGAPEIIIGRAKFAPEIVMTASGPLAKILLAEVWLGFWPQSQRGRRLKGPPAGAGEVGCLSRQFRP